MARTILDPQYANDLNGLFDGTGTINTGVITCAGVVSSGNISTTGTMTAGTGITATTGNITATTGNIFATGAMTAGTGITATTGNITATTGNITATTGNIIATTGNINASNGSITASQTVTGLTLVAQSSIICTGNIQGTTFGGGIGQVVVRGAMPGTISPNGSYTFSNIEIPGFIGYSATTAYVVSQNITTSPPIPFIYSVSYAGTTPTSTLVDVLVMNVGTLSYNTEINFSIIAMN